MNNTILLDTSELIRGLESLAYPSKDWSRKRRVNRYSGLRLCYHLMTKDGISYDGNVREENRELIDSALDGIANNLSPKLCERFRERLDPVRLNDDQELKLANKSIKDAINYFQDCADSMLKDFREGDQFGGGLSKIEKYLLKPIQVHRPPDSALEELMNNDAETGRRFFVAIYKDDLVYERVKSWVSKDAYEPKEYGLFFTLFRIKLSEYRAIHLSQNHQLNTCFYEPDDQRGSIITRIPQEHGEGVHYAKLLEEGMYRVWLGKQNQHIIENADFQIPSILNLPLKEASKAMFLEKVLDFEKTDFKEQYDKALEIISGLKVKNIDEFRKNLDAALYSAKGKEILISDNSCYGLIADGQDLAEFCLKSASNVAQDLITEGSVTSILGSIVRIGTRMFGSGMRAGTKVQKSFGNDILTMTKENRNLKIDEIFA